MPIESSNLAWSQELSSISKVYIDSEFEFYWTNVFVSRRVRGLLGCERRQLVTLLVKHAQEHKNWPWIRIEMIAERDRDWSCLVYRSFSCATTGSCRRWTRGHCVYRVNAKQFGFGFFAIKANHKRLLAITVTSQIVVPFWLQVLFQRRGLLHFELATAFYEKEEEERGGGGRLNFEENFTGCASDQNRGVYFTAQPGWRLCLVPSSNTNWSDYLPISLSSSVNPSIILSILW